MAPSLFPPKRPRVRSPRKSTAKRQREEKAALLKDMETLRRQLRRHARRDSLPISAALPSQPTPPLFDNATITAAQLYQQLKQAETDHDLWFAGLCGFLRSYETAQQRSPLRVPLHLSTDPAQRCETLYQCHAAKIRDAHAFVLRQCGSLDPTIPYLSLNKDQHPASGVQRITSLEIMPFPTVYSVQRVFDAMRFWMSNVELCITDELGALTIREDDEDDGTTEYGDAYSSLRRVRSTLACNVPIEGNFAIFRQLFQTDGETYAVLAIQPVDEDALYPYHPDEAVKVEITGAMVISQPTSTSCVTLTRWATLALTDRVSAGGERGEATPERMAMICKDAARWFEVLNHVLRERVYTSADVGL